MARAEIALEEMRMLTEAMDTPIYPAYEFSR